jgi:hypothetical protein
MDPALLTGGHCMHVGCTAPKVDPNIVVTEILDTVSQAIANQPRTLQKMIGPSEIGHPCDRRLGYKLAGVPESNPRSTAWKPYVGSQVHEGVGDIMAKAELARWQAGAEAARAATTRWHVEERVTVGELLRASGIVPITGSTDLFDAYHGIVFDWKFTGIRQISRNYKPKGPGRQYRTQAHLYGDGWVRAGFDVQHVAIIFMTREGEFADRHVWTEPYDPTVGPEALARLQRIQTSLDSLGPDFVIPVLEATENYCGHCPFFKENATDLAQACPGVAADRGPAVPPARSVDLPAVVRR